MHASLSLLLALANVASAAEPDASGDQHLVYDLSMNGQKIGTRDLTVHYATRDGVERRVLEAYTEVTVAGKTLKCRTTGFAGAHGATFTSSVDQAGAISQIQGTELPNGGWRVIVNDGRTTDERTLSADEARLSSLDLLDPVRSGVLAKDGPAGLVLVESGQVLSGTVAAPVEGTAKIDGQKVRIRHFALTGPLGAATFDVDGDGFLLHSEIQWLGGTVVASIRSLPPARSFGTVEKLDTAGPAMSEDPL
jgi:hypothetical protein